MKINDLFLKEDIQENLEQYFEKIINTDFFQTYFKPKIYEEYEPLKDHEDGYDDFIDLFTENTVASIDYVALYHGAKGRPDIAFYDFKYRKKPKDTDSFVHDYINEQTMEKIGEPVRNLFYTTRSETEASAHGFLYYVIPIGNTKYYYHPKINDLTSHYGANDIIDISRMVQLILDETNINNEYDDIRDIRNKIVIPILDYLEEYGFEKQFIEDFVADNLDIIQNENEKQKLIDIIYDVMERDLNSFNNYINEIEKTNDHMDIPPKSEIMMKTEQFALVMSQRFEDLIEYYYNNYLKDT